MYFTGLPLSTLLPLGIAAGAAVVGLYILKLKRRPHAVPFIKIWENILGDKTATSLFSQLKRILSLLLQLVLLFLILFALGDPRTSILSKEGRHIVVLVDASASMQAKDVAPNRLEKAKLELNKLVRNLSGSDRMLIAQMDASITPLSMMTSEISDLEVAVASIHPTETKAEFQKAVQFAADTLRGLSNPEILIVSDGALEIQNDKIDPQWLASIYFSFLSVGEQSKNAAITEFSVRRYPLDRSRYEVLLEVANTSDEPLDIELTLRGDGQTVDMTRLHLQPNEKLPRFYPNLSGASKNLEAEIKLADGSSDFLQADDHAYALLPERKRARIQVATDGNMFLEAALLLDEYLDVTTVTPAKYPANGKFDVTIFDNVTPNVAQNSGSLIYLNPSSSNVPFEVGSVVEDNDGNYKLGFDELESKHPILRYTSMGDINIGRAHFLKGDKEDKSLGRSYKGTLLLEGQRSGVKFLALGFDIRESDFPLRMAWPLFLLNSINYFIEEDTQYISSFQTGKVWHIPSSSASTSADLKQPGGIVQTVPVEDGRAIFLGQRAGFYDLVTKHDGIDETHSFAANLSSIFESQIKPIKEIKMGQTVAGPVRTFQAGVRKEIWIYLLIAVTVISTFEWLSYHRRWTV